MPIYALHCEKCKKTIEIIRSIHAEECIPTDEEAGKCKTAKAKHAWVKKIGTFMLQKGRGWGPGKGSW